MERVYRQPAIGAGRGRLSWTVTSGLILRAPSIAEYGLNRENTNNEAMSGILLAAQAVRLLGAQVVLTGIRPEVARSLIELGTTLQGIVTCGTLQAGIAYAIRDGGSRR